VEWRDCIEKKEHRKGTECNDPPQSKILETKVKTAARVAKVVFENDLALVERPADLEAFIRSRVYTPECRSLNLLV
jgi:hypothetical protein